MRTAPTKKLVKATLTILTILVLLFIPSCSNDPIAKLTVTTDVKDPEELHADSWQALFEEFWAVMNEDYVHFAYETEIDWDATYKDYIDKFKTLDYSKAEDSFTAFKYFKEIIWNLSDYHYHLDVTDNFGFTLDARPSVLQKWKAQGKDIMDFPDIIKTVITEDEETKTTTKTYFSVNEGPTVEYTRAQALEKWNIAVSGFSEVEDLQKAGTFHNPTGNIEDTYYASTYREVNKIAKAGNMYWDNFIVDSFQLEGTSWCTGITKNGVLYIYFSQFVDKDLITFCNYIIQAETMTDDEKEVARNALPSTIGTAINSYNKLSAKKGDTEDQEKYEKRAQLATQINAIVDVFRYLNSAVAKNKVALKDGTTVQINGIVIDLRDNGGGYAEFMTRFMSTFFASDKTLGYCRYKMGFSRYDYTPWLEFNLNGYNSALTEDYQGRLAVITNGFSVSCSEITTIASKLLPNSKIFGSTTFGGTCALASREEFQSGPYENGTLTVRSTTVRYKAFDQTSYEKVGIQPDVPIALSSTEDNRFTAAVNWAAGGEL